MYTKSITRANRALFVLCIDESGSMAELISTGGRTISKSEMVAEVANTIIAELIERSRRGSKLHDYYDIAIVGYSGAGVSSHFEGYDYISVTEVAAMEVERKSIESQFRAPDGSECIIHENLSCWVKPRCDGQTPMYEALSYVHSIIKKWCQENPTSFPPIVYNVTDGLPTDCDAYDMCDMASMIKSVSTDDGAALLFNIHISSSDDGESIMFPTDESIEPYRYGAQNLYHMYESASYMPEIFYDAICDIVGERPTSKFKGLCYNSSVAELIAILNIGSISVRRG